MAKNYVQLPVQEGGKMGVFAWRCPASGLQVQRHEEIYVWGHTHTTHTKWDPHSWKDTAQASMWLLLKEGHEIVEEGGLTVNSLCLSSYPSLTRSLHSCWCWRDKYTVYSHVPLVKRSAFLRLSGHHCPPHHSYDGWAGAGGLGSACVCFGCLSWASLTFLISPTDFCKRSDQEGKPLMSWNPLFSARHTHDSPLVFLPTSYVSHCRLHSTDEDRVPRRIWLIAKDHPTSQPWATVKTQVLSCVLLSCCLFLAPAPGSFSLHWDPGQLTHTKSPTRPPAWLAF